MSMVPNHFYHAHTRRLLAAFGQMFTGIDVARYDQAGNIIELIKNIPVENEMADKAYARHKIQEHDGGPLSTRGHVTLPRMSYQINGIQYNGNRKIARMNRIIRRGNDGDLRVTPVQTPMDFNLQLKIMALTYTDAIQIYEQIAWAFTPTFTIAIKDVPFDTEHADVPITLVSQNFEDTADDDYDGSRRLVLITLNFNAEYWFYGPAGSDRELQAARLKTGNPDATIPPIKPGVEKLIIDVYGAENEFYNGNESGIRYTVTDPYGDGNQELVVEIPPDTP